MNVSGSSKVTTLNPVTKPCPPPQPPPPLPPPPPPPGCPTDAAICSGFESLVTLDARTCTFNQWQFLHGIDPDTGFNFDTEFPWGSSLRWGGLNVVVSGTGTNPPPDMSQCGKDYQEQSLITVRGPDGNPTRVYKNELKLNNPNACCEGSGGFGTSQMSQNPTINTTDDFYARFDRYISGSLKQHALNLPLSERGHFWASGLGGMKTPTDLRIHPLIVAYHLTEAGNLTPVLEIDSCGANPEFGCGGPSPEVNYVVQDSTFPIPMDQWFTIEYAWRLRNDSTGKYQLAINGQMVFDYHGPIMGPDPSKWKTLEHVNNMSLGSVYSYKNARFFNYMDDLVISQQPPCGTFPCGA
jgi:hypothetical protein